MSRSLKQLLLIFAVGALVNYPWELAQSPLYAGMGDIRAVHVVQRWAYTNQMPRLPGLDVGIAPVAQMLILPPLVFRIVAVILKKYRNLLGMRP